MAQLSPGASVRMGDSLFVQKKYMQALSVYEKEIQHYSQTSPAMLLKMAFITESLGDYTKTLYYLNLYHQRKPRQQVALKMNELASRYSLTGYDYGDWDFFLIFYRRYYLLLVMGLIALSTWMLIGMIRKKIRQKFVAGRHGMALIVFLASMLVVYNLPFNNHKAIVREEYAYLMDAPSAGAKLVQIIRKGNRLSIQGEQDIWLHTRWAGKPAYIRKQNVWLVE